MKPKNEGFVLSTVRNPQPIEGAKVYDLYSKKMVTLDGRGMVAKGKVPLMQNHSKWKMGRFTRAHHSHFDKKRGS